MVLIFISLAFSLVFSAGTYRQQVTYTTID